MIFIYPYFLLLLFVPLVLLLIKHLSQKSNSWASICDAHLLPFLTIQTTSKENIFYKRLLILTWCLACICLAGPAVLKKDISTAFVGNGIAVVVDMSPAMDKAAAEQMTRKLYDLLNKKNDFSFGLVLADSKAYMALPITQDKAIFKNIIPTLKEQIMPTIGQNIPAGIKKAEDLLDQSGFKNGQILLITAGIAEDDEAIQAIRNSSHPIYVLGVGNDAQKHPVTLPNGQFWGGQTPVLVGLESLSNATDIKYNYASLDDSDLEILLNNSLVDKIEKSDQTVEQYQNLGIYGILLLLPLTALLFRRGVLFLFLICLLTSPCYAGFWWRTEQELYQKQMQGVADFNLGQYDKAQQQFSNVAPFDIEALYNLGTAQAYAGNFQQAIATYEQVLAKNPNHADAAYNLEYLKKQIPPPEQQQSSNQQDSDTSNSDEQSQDDENQSDENKENDSSSDSDKSDNQNDDANSENEQQSSDAEQNENASEQNEDPSDEKEQSRASQTNEESADQQKQDTQENGQIPPSDKAKTEQQTTVAMQNSDGQEAQQASLTAVSLQDQKQREWLDQVKPDAGRVLRYRLFKQYQEQQ